MIPFLEPAAAVKYSLFVKPSANEPVTGGNTFPVGSAINPFATNICIGWLQPLPDPDSTRSYNPVPFRCSTNNFSISFNKAAASSVVALSNFFFNCNIEVGN